MANESVVRVLNTQLSSMLAQQKYTHQQIETEKALLEKIQKDSDELDETIKQMEMTIRALGGTVTAKPDPTFDPYQAGNIITNVEDGNYNDE